MPEHGEALGSIVITLADVIHRAFSNEPARAR